jgi:hypothetical protein
MRHAQRLAAAERRVGNAERADGLGDPDGLVGAKLVRPAPVGAGFLAAGEAARLAAVGQLPGDEEGSAVLVGRAAARG